MRIALLLAALALAGCIERPPAIQVVNESDRPASGEIRMWLDAGWRNDTSRETGHWRFDVAARAVQDLGRLPREPAEYHYMVVRADDGREGWGRPLNHAHANTLTIRITDDALVVEPQAVT